MKINITNEIQVEPVIIQTMKCPTGTAYWTIDYQIEGITVYSLNTKAIDGSPSPIAYLDYTHERFFDVDAEHTRSETKTHREWLLDAISQIQ